MNKIIIAVVMLFLLIGCGEGGCKQMSWEASSSLSLKSGAGNQCGNINDYYDIDIEEIISEIQKMKFILNDTCKEVNFETGEMEDVQCPELVPETIEFGEVVSCSFSTPPAENTKCSIGPLGMSFSSDTYFERISWEFDVENPDNPTEFYSYKNDKSMNSGDFSFNDKKDSILFSWTETSDEGVEEVKKIHAEYSVETK